MLFAAAGFAAYAGNEGGANMAQFVQAQAVKAGTAAKDDETAKTGLLHWFVQPPLFIPNRSN